MIDFVSIIYHNKEEINLLKLQLFSFKFVDIDIINNIYILFNDSKDNNKLFENEYDTNIIQYVPEHLITKIKIIFITDLIDLTTKYITNWWSQQFAKIYVSKIIQSEYYIMLDSKNIFIKPVDKSTFFIDKKIKMYYSTHNDLFLKWYKNCFDYFEIETYNPYKHPLYIQTTTPFVFITQECKNLIHFIENKENMNLYHFFMNDGKYTEFFLYFAWIQYVSNKDYIFVDKYIDNVIIGPFDPNIYVWNSWESKYNGLATSSVVSISSKCLPFIDKTYKNNIKNYINSIFHDKKMNDLILTFLNIK